VLVLSAIIFVVTSLWTGSDVKNYCSIAEKRYGGDCVEALIMVLDDKNNPYDERNSAIWALGQLGDPKAIPYLNKYYTPGSVKYGNDTNSINQGKLEKALKLTSGAANLSAIIWRHNLP